MKIIGLKELRENTAAYEKQIVRGQTFIVVRRGKPLFKISPVDEDEQWKEVIDFTKLKKGGVNIKDLLQRL